MRLGQGRRLLALWRVGAVMLLRGKGARHAYQTCRSFGLGVLHSLWRATRYAVTGRTGKYRIQWRPSSKTPNVGNEPTHTARDHFPESRK